MASARLWFAAILAGSMLGIAALAGQRKSKQLGEIQNEDRTGPKYDDYERRARAAGARGKLKYIGAGAEGYVMCDEHGTAFKVAQEGADLRDEAKWLQMAAKIPSIKQHVPKFARYDAEERVLVRECLTPRDRHDIQFNRKKHERVQALHERLHEVMKPYGYGRPEFKSDAYVYTKRGPVLVDAGFAVRRGNPLVQDVLATLKQDTITLREGEDHAYALRYERGKTVPAPIADKLLKRLKARVPSVEI